MGEELLIDSVATGKDSTIAVTGMEFRPDLVDGFFHDNTLLHPELPYRTWGQAAEPRPYSLQRDDIVVGALLIALCILIYCFNKTKQQLKQQTKDFFFATREHKSLFPVETSIENYTRKITIILLSLLGGLAIFAYAQHTFNFFFVQLSPHMMMGLYVVSLLAMFAVKRIMSSLVNWIFFPKSQQKTWNDACAYLNYVEVLLFFPLLIIYIFFIAPFEKTVTLFLFILLSIKFLLTFKAYNIFFSKSYGVLHLFAYLCALEIMPLLALWKLLAIMTENLIVKY